MSQTVCVHQLSEVQSDMLPGFRIVSHTSSRKDLMDAIGTRSPGALIIDLDEPDALNTIVEALEVRPQLAVVGVTQGTDLKYIIAAQRAGCSHISTRPLDPNDLVVALRHAIDQTGEATMASETFALLGSIGGAGTTTIACHLAVELAQLDSLPTALFDLDLDFGGVARSLDLTPQFSVADLASAGAVDAVLLEKAAVRLDSGPFVFARPPGIPEAHAVDEHALRNILKASSRVYRYVLLDLPRKLDHLTGAAIEHCNKLLLVLQLTVPSIDNAKRFIDALTAEGVGQDRLEIVVNRYRKNLANCTIELVERQLGQNVIGVIPSDYESVNKAIDIGTTLSQRSPVRTAIRQLAERLTGRDEKKKPANWLSKVGLRR
ncbi:MAG: hypothetical protein HRF50_11685 [Phycisphaerae bacterium]